MQKLPKRHFKIWHSFWWCRWSGFTIYWDSIRESFLIRFQEWIQIISLNVRKPGQGLLVSFDIQIVSTKQHLGIKRVLIYDYVQETEEVKPSCWQWYKQIITLRNWWVQKSLRETIKVPDKSLRSVKTSKVIIR